MKHVTIVLLATILGGCANTPTEIREQGPRAQVAMRLPPAAAAACVARNVANTERIVDGHVGTQIRDVAAPGQTELLMFAGAVYYVTATFAPDREGSVAAVSTRPGMIGYLRQRFLGTFRGC